MKPMIKAAMMLVLTLAASLPGGIAFAEPSETVANAEFFAVMLPDGFAMKKESPAEDFELYTISDGTEPYLYIYIGNQPNYPQPQREADNQITELDVHPLKILSEWAGDKLMRRELLAALATSKGWPNRVHAWTAALSGDDLETADRILFSLRIKPAN